VQRRQFSLSACLALPLLFPDRAAAEGKPKAPAGPYTESALLDLSGDSTSLQAQAAGKALVVVVMKGHYCSVCRAQLKRLQARHQELAQLGAEVVGLNADPARANREVAGRFQIPFQLLSDPEHRVIGALGLWNSRLEQPLPSLLVFDACGKECGRWLGRAPGQRPEARLFALLKQVAEDAACAPQQA
jgi:peroxiredoxin